MHKAILPFSDEQLEQGNEIISKFRDTCLVHPDDRKYHENWEWLMPVIISIAKLELKYLNEDETYHPYPRTFGMLDEEGNFMVRLSGSQLFVAKELIHAAWLAVVDFLEDYIKNPNNANIPQ